MPVAKLQLQMAGQNDLQVGNAVEHLSVGRKIPNAHYIFHNNTETKEHMLDFRNIFPWLLFKTIHLSGPKLLNIVSGQNYGRSKTGLASMSSPP